MSMTFIQQIYSQILVSKTTIMAFFSLIQRFIRNFGQFSIRIPVLGDHGTSRQSDERDISALGFFDDRMIDILHDAFGYSIIIGIGDKDSKFIAVQTRGKSTVRIRPMIICADNLMTSSPML